MVLRLVLFNVFLLCVARLAAQTDTTMLAPLEIYGTRILPYTTGTKVSVLSMDNSVQSLASLLTGEASVYLKNYGNEQLSTIGFRGTTASQTAVLWNGINVNSPTLGQSDFSVVPTFLFDEVVIQYGAGSALVGSDAIGGSISLNSRPISFSNQVRGLLHMQVGSFGRLSNGIKINGGDSKWYFETSYYGFKIRNDFPYRSPAVGFERKQENAAVESDGLRHKIAFKINESQQLSIEGIYVNNFRENQPTVTNFGANETLGTKQYRLALHYDNTSVIGVLRTTIAAIRDEQVYTDDISSVISTNQWAGILNVDKQLTRKATIRWGASASWYGAIGDNYPVNLLESRYDLFASLRYSLTSFWVISTNLRQTFYDIRYAPFAPSLGTEVLLVKYKFAKLSARSQTARAFRIPTLNDRYWLAVGNLNIKAEEAWQYESGLQWELRNGTMEVKADIGYYKTQTNNMIVWLPGDGSSWVPDNLQEVSVEGAEASVTANSLLGTTLFSGKLSYSYTESINKRGIDILTIGKQLPYVPLHSARATVQARYVGWGITFHNNYVSKRYISLQNSERQALDPYLLLDAELSKEWKVNDVILTTRVQVGNFFDLYYENFAKHAMPGRNFSISLSLRVNNKIE